MPLKRRLTRLLRVCYSGSHGPKQSRHRSRSTAWLTGFRDAFYAIRSLSSLAGKRSYSGAARYIAEVSIRGVVFPRRWRFSDALYRAYC
jgi:hypothetical protein